MKVFWKTITVICAWGICLNGGLLCAQSANNWMNDQDDQTDIYAIPLDSSEEEERSEEETLKNTQKRSPVTKNSSRDNKK